MGRLYAVVFERQRNDHLVLEGQFLRRLDLLPTNTIIIGMGIIENSLDYVDVLVADALRPFAVAHRSVDIRWRGCVWLVQKGDHAQKNRPHALSGVPSLRSQFATVRVINRRM